MTTSTLIFDLDSTLIDTGNLYWQVKNKFLDLMVSISLNRVETNKLLDVIDTANLQEKGYGPDRYLESMRKTYIQSINEKNIKPDQSIENRIVAYGKELHDRVPDLIEGARELLEWCFERYPMILITRGEEWLQNKKIRHYGFEKYFKEIYIVHNKQNGLFKEIVEKHNIDVSTSWSIGDSITADINPALEVGLNCILCLYTHHLYYWEAEYGKAPTNHVHKVDNLTEIPAILSN